MTKEALAMDAWLKDVTPSTGLREWFGHRTALGPGLIPAEAS